MSKGRPTLKKQLSVSEAPVPTTKGEFESFFGFVESNFDLIDQTVKSVTYKPGNFTINERLRNVSAEAVASTLINLIAGNATLTPKLKSALLSFFAEPPVLSTPTNSRVIVRSPANNKLEAFLLDLNVGQAKKFNIAIHKALYTVTYWESSDEVPSDESIEYILKVFLMRDLGTSDLLSNWEFKISGLVDIKNADTKLYNKLAKEFENSFKSDGIFTTSAISALTKPRAAIYDTVEVGGAYQPPTFPKSEAVRLLIDAVVKSNILFSSYTSIEQSAIVDAFEMVAVAPREVVVKEGDRGNYFYIIENGELEVIVNIDGEDEPVGRKLMSGEYFGELALMYNTPRAATVQAASKCSLWRIDRRTYRQIVTYYHNSASAENALYVKNVQLLGKRLGDVLSQSELDKVVNHLEVENFIDGAVIIRQGNVGDNFYIIKSGNVSVWQQQMVDGKAAWVQLTTLKKGDFFGEKALLSEDVRQASCIAVGDVTCLTLSREDFNAMLGTWADLSAGERKAEEIASAEEHRNFLKKIVLEDLNILRVLGQGAFGKVKLAQHNITGETFALKCQSKKAIVKQRIEANVINEMRLMRLLDHKHIGKLYCALQDTRNIYFVLELLQGGEFFTYLQRVGRLAENKAAFYAASVVSAYTELHSKKIAYRDLKPENMVMDAKGYVKIVDLGLAKQILSGKTWTMCGTPDYLAPEIILNEGHDIAVDYWALGVLIYEMVTGWPPFYADEPMKTYEKIVACSLTFPVYITRPLSDLVSKLLTTQPGRRLGNLKGGINDIMKHKWFGSFDWAGLDAGTLPPPFVPTIKDSTDVSNFENFADEPLPDESTWVADLR